VPDGCDRQTDRLSAHYSKTVVWPSLYWGRMGKAIGHIIDGINCAGLGYNLDGLATQVNSAWPSLGG